MNPSRHPGKGKRSENVISMKTAQDKYPSRTEGAEQILTRETPVIADDSATRKGPLTPEQVSAYERDGYLFFDSFYDSTAVKVLEEETERLRVSEEVRQSELAVTEPTSGATRSIFAVQTVSEVFANLSRDKRILEMVHQLMGNAVYLHQSRLNLKPGFQGKEYYWHSDFETWHTEDGMPDMRAISCSIALTDGYEHNGPLMVIPGSHKYFCQCAGRTPENNYQQSLKRQDYGIPSDEQLTWLTDQAGIAVPNGPVGSILLTDSNLMHGSNCNITPYPRKNAVFVYNDVNNTLEEPFGATYQRPWYLGNREPETLEPIDITQTLSSHSPSSN